MGGAIGIALALVAANEASAAADRTPIKGFSIEASFKLMRLRRVAKFA
jgi:hypothetical protein